MKKVRVVMGMFAMLGAAAVAQERPVRPPPPRAPQQMQMTAEQRRQMAAAHEKMATCLRTDRALADCHEELMQTCQQTMGTSTCPMMGGMGMGPMHHGHMGQQQDRTK